MIDDHLQFTATHANLSGLLRQYSLDLLRFEEATGGIENRTLIVTSSQGKRVVRVYRQNNKSLDDVGREVTFINHMDQAGVPVVVPDRNQDGEFITRLADGGQTWMAVVMPFVPGMHPPAYTPGLLAQMAEIQARMHLAATDFKPVKPEERIRRGLTSVFHMDDEQRVRFSDPELRALLGRAEAYTADFNPTLPRGYCHTDFCDGNLLVHDDGSIAAVLDFDDLRDVPYVVCLGYTLWDVGIRNREHASLYREKYEALRPLSTAESSFVKPAMLFRHYMITLVKALYQDFPEEDIMRYLAYEQELQA